MNYANEFLIVFPELPGQADHPRFVYDVKAQKAFPIAGRSDGKLVQRISHFVCGNKGKCDSCGILCNGRNKMKKKRFQQKKVIVCCGEKMTSLTIRPWMQVGFVLVCLAAAYWVLQTSVLYFFSNDLIRTREIALAEKQSENNRLKKELAYYQNRVEQSEKLALDIQQAHKDILDKVDLLVSEEEIEMRRKELKPFVNNSKGYLGKYSRAVQDASHGAIV